MGSAPRYVFPGAIFGSVLLGILALSLTSGVVLPADLVSPGSNSAIDLQSVAQEALSAEASPSVISVTGCDVSSKYPGQILQWCQSITSYSIAAGLDPDLVAALIWQESGGDQWAYSKSGAVGLMQVMPRDGLAAAFMCINGPCFANRPGIQELQDPVFNLEFGTTMLGGLLRKHGDMREALKYYGPKDVGYYYADIVLGLYDSYKD